MIDIEGFVGPQRGRRFRRAALVLAAGAMALGCELIIGDPPPGEVLKGQGGVIGVGGTGGTEVLHSGGRAVEGGTTGGGPDVHFGGYRSQEDPTPRGEGGAMETGGSGGSTSTEPPSEGGAAGAPEGGAGGAPCSSSPRTWFLDEDDDGYGSEVSVFACDPPAGNWTTRKGDCDDHWPDVHPGQSRFFGVPYTTSNGIASFDYDCSGAEEPNPSQTLAAKDCGALKLALCGDESGYVTNNRSGPGIFEYCGSTIVRACVPSLLVCETTERANQPPFSCR